VKGALFARYSRSPKSLRRLFLDEFLPSGTPGAPVGFDRKRAEELCGRMFFEYGDDSVAQLGGVHLACEGASNILTKVLEWGRLAAYLEQSTRYIPYDDLVAGRYRYHVPRELEGDLHTRYVETLDAMFDAYRALLPVLRQHFTERFPREAQTSEAAYRTSIRAKALDTLRGLLPAATTSNVGPDGEGRVVAAALYAVSDVADDRLLEVAQKMSEAERRTVLDAYVGRRTNRRQRPGRAFERTAYRFDVLADYGAFRDLQRHRLLTLEWQRLSPRHGSAMPEAIAEAHVEDRWHRALDASASLHDAIAAAGLVDVAPYAVAMAYRIRFYMEMN